MVRLIVPKSIEVSIAPYLLEQTMYPISNDEDNKMIFNKEEIDNALEKIKALAIGMGWGSGKDNEKILTYILEEKNIPCIIDADGLNTLAKMDLNILKKAKNKIILTPHLKEFERISKNPIEKKKEKPAELAIEFAKNI